MGGYVPTGGQFNDPNTWKTDPQYGQVGANRGAGFNPDYWSSRGGYDAFKASRRAYRAQFQPGGKNYDKYMNTYAAIGAAQPQTKQQLGQLLNSLGIYDQKEMGQSLFRSIGMDFDNNINGMYQYNKDAGTKLNVGTSDVNAKWEPMTADDWANVNRGFYGRIDDMFGGSRFNAWSQSGKSGLVQGPGGYWYNPNGKGGYSGDVYDSAGWTVDPSTGRRVGGGYMRYMGSNLGSLAGGRPAPAAVAPEQPYRPPVQTSTAVPPPMGQNTLGALSSRRRRGVFAG